jgi:membrane protease YdiL (CAAX protease family)
MNVNTDASHPGGVNDSGSDPWLLAIFAAIALPSGWILLSIPLILDLPSEPFVLATLLFGLVVPALLLSRSDPTTSARELLRQAFRVPRPLTILLPALVAIPVLTWVGGRLVGADATIDGDLVVGLLVNVASSIVIVNLWEEMAWTGFVQRRAMARWGTITGSLLTAALFVGIHLPLAFDGNPAAGLAALVVAGIGLRLLVAGTWTWSGHSVIAVAVLHASFNASSELVDSDHDWIRYGVTVLAGLVVAAALVRGRGRGSPGTA